MLDYVKELNQFFEIQDSYLSVKDNNARKQLHIEDSAWPREPLLNFLNSVKPVTNNNFLIKIEESSKQRVQPPHSDGIKGSYTCLIPLRWYGDVYTIEYHQTYNGTNDKVGVKYRPTGNTYYEDEWLSEDTQKISGLIDKDFDRSFFEEYLKHTVDYADLYGLTVNKMHKWTMGEPIVFPCEVLHSGCAFQVVKRWLVCHNW